MGRLPKTTLLHLLPMKLLRICILLMFCVELIFSPAHCYEQEDLENRVNQLLQRSRQQAEQMQLPQNQHTQEGKQAAEQASKDHRSRQSQTQIARQQTDIKKQFLGCKEEEKERNQPATQDTENLYLFISSSMPESLVQGYLFEIHSLQSAKIIPVMRGLVGGSTNLKATVRFFDAVTREDPACRDHPPPGKRCPRFNPGVRIDPHLFERFQISEVPALVYQQTDTIISIGGAVPLATLIEGIREKSHSQFLDTLVSKLQTP